MKWLRNHLGMGLMLLGTVLLLTVHLLRLTFVNALLIVPFVFILLGLLLHVRAIKRQSQY